MLDRLKRFAVLVCHRGWGKTTLGVNVLVKGATETPHGEYAYLAPLYKQAKAAAWKTLKAAVPSPPVKINESELRADFPNGSTIKLLGADDYDSLRGQHLDGIVLDEYALIDPAAWGEVIRPALSVKRGSAIFIGTPKGRNHFHALYEAARKDPALWLTALYTYRDSGVLPESEIELARAQMTADEFAQEYECSWEAALKGAYYARQMELARLDGRIKAVPWEPAVPVQTFWDLGWSDATAIVFVQQMGRELHMIDYCEGSGHGLEHYIRDLSRKPYLYGRHYLPHDAGHAQQGLEGRTLAQQAQQLGLRPVTVLGQTDVLAGIDTVRRLFARCWFDESKCAALLNALSAYRQEWDDKRHDWREKPLHDWASHGADAFRYLAITVRDEQPTRVSEWALGGVRRPPARAKTHFHPYDALHGGRR